MSSAEEAMATLQTAEALGYLAAKDLPGALDKLDHVVCILVKICR